MKENDGGIESWRGSKDNTDREREKHQATPSCLHGYDTLLSLPVSKRINKFQRKGIRTITEPRYVNWV